MAHETQPTTAGPSRWRIWPERLAIIAISVGLTLAICEVGFRIAGFSALHDVYSKPSLLWQHDPVLGWSHEPGATGTYVGPRPFPIEFNTQIAINSHGLRGPEILPKAEGQYRILVLGDSVVVGFEVRESQTFVRLSEKALRRRFGDGVEVINAGVRGYGTDQSYLWYREPGKALDADLVVFSHSANDHFNNISLHRIRRPFGKAALRPSDSGLELVGTPVEPYPTCSEVGLDDSFEIVRTDGWIRWALCGLQIGLSDHSALFSFLVTRMNQNPDWIRWLNEQVIAERSLRPTSPALSIAGFSDAPRGSLAGKERRHQLTSLIIRALADEVSEDGASFLWLMSRHEQDKFDLTAPELAGLVPVSLEGFSRYPLDRLRFRNDLHYSALGHRFWSELMVPELERIIQRDRPDLDLGVDQRVVPLKWMKRTNK